MFNKCSCNQSMPAHNNYCVPKMDCLVTEPMMNKCVEENIFYKVNHVVPIHTHMVKKHIYNHTYTPQFTCSEECAVVNNECGCPKFMNR